jgi:hypothetical protein
MGRDNHSFWFDDNLKSCKLLDLIGVTWVAGTLASRHGMDIRFASSMCTLRK